MVASIAKSQECACQIEQPVLLSIRKEAENDRNDHRQVGEDKHHIVTKEIDHLASNKGIQDLNEPIVGTDETNNGSINDLSVEQRVRKTVLESPTAGGKGEKNDTRIHKALEHIQNVMLLLLVLFLGGSSFGLLKVGSGHQALWLRHRSEEEQENATNKSQNSKDQKQNGQLS